MTTRFTVSYPVPYAAQLASPELAYAFFAQGMNPALDPRWAESGAESPAEYAYWVDRACGIACVKMCVEALGGPQRRLLDWVRDGLALDGYLVAEDENGQPVEKGWVHRALAELIQRAGFHAQPRPAGEPELLAWLRQDQMVIASVSYEIGDNLPITRKGGHLVVLHGADLDADEQVQAWIVHNPSGRHAETRTGARIPRERFAQAFSGRVILVSRQPI